MDTANPKSNGYGVLRFIFAMSVVYSHSFALSGSKDVDLVQRITGLSSSHFGVIGFFILSGYLNAQSLARGSATRWTSVSFLVRRSFRIFPLLWSILLVTVVAYVVSAAAGHLDSLASNRDAPHGKVVWNALKTALRFSRGNAIPFSPHYSLPGVFAENPNRAICGSLWTLPHEMLFYLVLSISPFFRHMTKPVIWSLMLFAAILSIIATTASSVAPPVFSGFQTYWIGTLGFAFLVGVVLSHMPMRMWITLTSAGILVIYFKFRLLTYGPVARALEILCVGIIVIHAGSVSLGRLSRFSEKWDPSYGIYLLSFPIQQIIVAHGFRSPMALLAMSSAIAIVCACLTWVFIERPMLRIGRNWTLRRQGTAITFQ